MEIFLTPEAWLALLTLTFFEVVLGIDNIIFISIVSNRLTVELLAKTRNMGLLLAMGVRILLLLTITWVMKFQEPLFGVPHWISEDSAISGRDLILIFGGMFLIAKSTREINHEMDGEEGQDGRPAALAPHEPGGRSNQRCHRSEITVQDDLRSRRQPVPYVERRLRDEQERGDRNDEHQQYQEACRQADEPVDFHGA